MNNALQREATRRLSPAARGARALASRYVAPSNCHRRRQAAWGREHRGQCARRCVHQEQVRRAAKRGPLRAQAPQATHAARDQPGAGQQAAPAGTGPVARCGCHRVWRGVRRPLGEHARQRPGAAGCGRAECVWAGLRAGQGLVRGAPHGDAPAVAAGPRERGKLLQRVAEQAPRRCGRCIAGAEPHERTWRAQQMAKAAPETLRF